MIIKYFSLKKNLDKDINFYLLYGQNSGLIEDTLNNTLKPNFSKNIYFYDESELLANVDEFKEEIYNESFFEKDKLIIINRGSDKLVNLIQELTEKKTDNIKIIIKADILEKKSKLRVFFEKNNETIIVPFYEDDQKTLVEMAHKFFLREKIKITPENINYIIQKTLGNRINLKNELEKISNYCQKRKTINLEELIKLSNSSENYNISELTDSCLANNAKKAVKILNENNSTIEENILIIKSFIFKLKRLKKIKEELEIKKNQDQVLNSFRPPIFWKDKEIIKQQLKNLSLEDIKLFIKKVDNLELVVKKNSQLSTHLVNNFIFERLNLSNNAF